MCKANKLADSFKTTYRLIGKFSEGLTHADSVAQPPFKANTFNWVLGHILVGRDRVLILLEQSPVLETAEKVLYETGSDPVYGEKAISLERLLKQLDISQKALIEGLEKATSGALAKIYDESRKQSVGDRLAGEHWHETYHVGQLEILRQVSGEREAFP